MKKLETAISKIDDLRSEIKNALKQAIENLPDNPNIKKLSGGAFSISSKELFSPRNPTQIMSAEYFDFKHQYKTISGIIERTQLEKLPSILNGIIDTASFKLNSTHTFRFHPDVISALKQTIDKY